MAHDALPVLKFAHVVLLPPETLKCFPQSSVEEAETQSYHKVQMCVRGTRERRIGRGEKIYCNATFKQAFTFLTMR